MRLSNYIILIILLFLLLPMAVGPYIDYLWFSGVGYQSVFLTIIKTKIFLGLLAGISFFLLAFLNIKLAIRNTIGGENSRLSNFILSLLFVFSVFVGIGISSGWDIVLRYFNHIPFGISDPVFNKDISFYFFQLPFYTYVKNIFLYGVGAVALFVFIIYFIYSQPSIQREPEPDSSREIQFEFPKLTGGAKAHLSLLAGFLFVMVSAGYLLERYSLLYSKGKTVFGAGYTDINIKLHVLTILVIMALLAAVILFLTAKYQDFKWPIAAIALLIFISIMGGLTASIVQNYKVEPDEFNFEKPYLQRNIEFTLKAYGLEDIKEVEFPVVENLTSEDIKNNSPTIDNVRLWDWQPIRRTYRQLQLIRTYYEFNDVDIDRYTVDSMYKQVMVSPREFTPEELQPQSRTWINEHLVYTHGYGLTMSPVRQVSEEGLPVLYIKDIPPKSEYFEVERPEIYYGELTNDYVVVDTTTQEFDYPKGRENVYTIYRGEGGVPLSSSIRKLAMAVRFNTIKLLVSESIKPSSKILFYRNIKERADTIAPFLGYDRDPYIVLSEGKLYWIIDAYTTSNKYPYSEPYRNRNINYIRNSVKVVVDAYNGGISFYVFDEKDPVIRTYMNIFPDLFKPSSEMPDELRKHIRYPEDIFTVQVEKYATYHMKGPNVFYTREDAWETPEEKFEDNIQPMLPYYLIMKFPDEPREEFILLIPFTPKGKKNMIAWMAARCDTPYYGQKIIFKFPKDKLIYGPLQIEARIDQDTEISQLFTLWGQSGSKVIRGNLLAIPIEDSLLYIEPIYIRAEGETSLPELKKVIVAFGNRLTMEDTLEESLNVIFGEVAEIEAPREAERSIDELIADASLHYNLAQEYLRGGNWTGYGAEIEKLGEIITELGEKQK